MKDGSGNLCVWCDNEECVLNHIGTRGPVLNFCMPEVTGCLDFHDSLAREKKELTEKSLNGGRRTASEKITTNRRNRQNERF